MVDNVQFNYIVSQALNMIMQFIISFVPCLMGVYAKEFYEITQRKKRKIDIKNVMVTSATLSCVAVSVTQRLLSSYGLEGTFTLLFLVGASSNKIIKMIFDGSLLKIIYKFLGKSKDSLQSSIEETLKEEKK